MVSFSDTIIDEIALEGLDGITLSGLWKILCYKYNLSDPIEDSFKKYVWSIIIQKGRRKMLFFYEIPGPIQKILKYDRHLFFHEDQGVYRMPDNKYFIRNPFSVIENSSHCNTPKGSCLMFKDRKRIPFLIINKFNIDDVERIWGTRMVMVASQQIRDRAIISENCPKSLEINAVQYAILEMVGKARYNGETFAGPNSMSTMMKDPKPLNYLCDLLHSCGLITKQTYNCKVGVGMEVKIIANKLLLLTRFNCDYKTAFYLLMEKMYNGIKLSKTKELDLSLINFNLDRKRTFKITQFKRLFKVNRMPTDDKDKKILVSLQSDDFEEEFIYADNEYRNKEFNIENLEEDQYRVDMSFVDQFYEICHSYGSVGISQSDMTRAMTISKLNMKLLIRHMEKLGLITSYKRDSGRQSLNMFVTIENRKNSHVLQAVAENVNSLANLKCTEQVSTPPVSIVQEIYDVAPDITSYIMEIQPSEPFDSSRINFSLRQSRRKTKIVEIIDKSLVIELITLKNMLLSWEKGQDLPGAICTKSVIRSVNWLAQKKIVNFFQMNVVKDNVHKVYKYITHPSITHDHRLVIAEKNRRRQELFLSLVSQKSREISQDVRGDSDQVCLIKRDLKAPKFLTAKYFHSLLYYLTFELDSSALPLVPRNEKINFDELFLDSRLSDMLLYRRTIDWKMFIPPLPKYEKSSGWIYLPDVIERIPLSIFSKLFPLDLEISEDLKSILNHPIKQHVLMKSLPIDIWAMLNRVRLQRTYANIVKLIACCGLIQMNERLYKDPNSLWIYLNRNATIMDTTKSEPGYNMVSLKHYRTLHFRFTCSHDTMSYWDKLQSICLNTNLGSLHKRNKMKKLVKKKPIPEIQWVRFEDAPSLDNGEMLGDNRGAGGIDSNHYSYLINNWNWGTSRKVAMNSLEGRSKRTKFIRRPKLIMHKKPATKMTHKIKRKVVSLKVSDVVGESKTKKKIKKIKYQPDSIDREAIKNMRSLRVKWTSEEDNILKIVKAVHLMVNVSPVDFILLQVAKIMRDVIRCSLGYQKTAVACLRRIQYILKEKKSVHSEIQSIICEFQKYPHIQRIYNTEFVNTMKSLYKNKDQFSNRLSVHFVLLCGYFFTMKSSDCPNNLYANQTDVPRTLDDFFVQYSEYFVITEKHYIIHTAPTTIEEAQVMALNNLIHSVLCSSKDKRNYSSQLLDIYKEYPEIILQKTLTKIKDDQMAVRLKRATHGRSKTSELCSSGLTYIFSNKYKQMMQFTRIPYEMFNKQYAFLKAMQNADSCSMKSLDIGEIFYLAEKNFDKGFVINSVKLPKKILTVDNNVQQNIVSEPERILEHFRQIFVNSPKTLYLTQFENEHQQNPSKNPKVKFTVTNEKYTIKQDPFEIVLKTTSNNIHFFCILSNMNKNCNLDFTKISKDAVDFCCPFVNCVLKASNICSLVETIVNEQKQYILEDSISSGNESENYTHCDNFVNIMILPGNFWKIFHYIKRYISEHNSKYEKKDIGKVQIPAVSVDMVALAKSILNYQAYNFNEDEFNEGNECEASFNKEQKLLKAQDIFVINLPEIVLKKDNRFALPAPNANVIINNLVRSCTYKPNHHEFNVQHPCLLRFSPPDRDLCFQLYTDLSKYRMGMDIPTIRSKYKDHDLVVELLNVLCENSYAMRLGVADYVYVHHKHVGPWLINSTSITRFGEGPLLGKRTHLDDDEEVFHMKKKKRTLDLESYSDSVQQLDTEPDIQFFSPQPWLRVNTVLNNRVLHKWLGSILTECITRCGCYISQICIRFSQMHPTSVRKLLEILEEIGSLELKVLKSSKATKSLFSKLDPSVLTEEKADGLCTKEEVFILPTVDAVSKLNLFIGDKKYDHDFI